jgi:hypothetical protein
LEPPCCYLAGMMTVQATAANCIWYNIEHNM